MASENRFRNLMARISCKIDRKRIKLHLKRAEKDLRQKDVDLEKSMERRRERHLDRLNDYWNAEEFPVNRDFPGERRPIFKDDSDVPCAMAYLMEEDGEQELVDHVAETENTVLIENIDEGPVAEWIESSGLTKEEAARIQPTYGPSHAVVSSCGPLACSTLQIIMLVFAGASFGLLERIGYKYASSFFPDNVLKKRATFGYFSVMNLLIASGLAISVYALFP